MSKGNPNATKATPMNVGKTTNASKPPLETVKAYITAMIKAMQTANKAEATGKKYYRGVHCTYDGFNVAFERDLGFSPKEMIQPEWKSKGIAAGPLAEYFHAHATKGGVKIYLPDDGPTAGDSTKALSASEAARASLAAAGINITWAS